MKPTKEEIAVAEFAKGILTYVIDGNVVELHECGFAQELKEAMKTGGLNHDEWGDDEDEWPGKTDEE